MSEEESTLNLQALQEACPNAPWSLTFSYGRALQVRGLPVLGAAVWARRGLGDAVACLPLRHHDSATPCVHGGMQQPRTSCRPDLRTACYPFPFPSPLPPLLLPRPPR